MLYWDIGLLETDIEVAIKASMIFWKINGLNEKADAGMDDTSINDVGYKINGKNPPNGEVDRKNYTKKAYQQFKK